MQNNITIQNIMRFRRKVTNMIGYSPVGALILDDLTIEDFRDIYVLCTTVTVAELNTKIDKANKEMDELKKKFAHVIQRHEDWICDIRKLMDDPSHKDKEVLVHSIMLHEGEIKFASERFGIEIDHLRSNLEHYRDQRSIIWAAKHHTLQQIREFALKKYQKDISKPKPYSRAKKPEEIPEEWEDS